MDDELEKYITWLKAKLSSYNEADLKFNEPHFTQQLDLREGNMNEVVDMLLNPEKLVYAYKEEGKFGDTKHCLH